MKSVLCLLLLGFLCAVSAQDETSAALNPLPYPPQAEDNGLQKFDPLTSLSALGVSSLFDARVVSNHDEIVSGTEMQALKTLSSSGDDEFVTLTRAQQELRDMNALVVAQRKAIAESEEAAKKLDALLVANKEILAKNEKVLKESSKALLDKVKSYTAGLEGGDGGGSGSGAAAATEAPAMLFRERRKRSLSP